MTKSVTHPASYEFTFKQDGTEHTINNISTHNYTYSYDKANRLMSSTESIAGTGDTYSGYLEIVNNFTYDNNGNTLTKTTGGQVDESVVQYGYNQLNQLIGYTAADGTVTSYGYDGTGMRVSKTQGNATQKFYWDRGYIVNEGDNSGMTVTNYVGLQGVFGRKTNGNTDYLLKNGHGDTTYRLNGENIENSYIYDAYGAVTNADEQDTNPFRYCGEYYDDESGLIYLRNRYYDPSMGRFITEDPVMDGNNWYAYCGNNPVNYSDPLGLWQFGDEQYPDYIQEAIREYTIEWELCNSIDDIQGMLMAHENAESARALGDSLILREDWGGQEFYDWESDPYKTEIAIHHTNNNDSIQEIEESHIDNNWSGIGYHFVIEDDGTVYEGRPIEFKGSHVEMANTGKIGVALVGDYHPGFFVSNVPTEEQLISMIRLVQVLKTAYGITAVKGHRDYNDQMPNTNTVCPGDTLYGIINRIY